MAEPMRQVKLGDLLSEKALKELAPIMNKIQKGDLDAMAGYQEISKKLEPYKSDLERKGVLHQYLAYVLVHISMQHGGPLEDVTLN